MKIKIFDVNASDDKNASETERMHYECVLFQVLQDCNTRFYLVTNDTYALNDDWNTARRTYWFPACEVKKGDVIQLWTKAGSCRSTPLFDGDADEGTKDTSWHNFYWGMEECVWNQEKARVTLVELDTIQVVSVKP